MAYVQRTWKAESGEPMHAESGFLRPHADGSIDIVIAQSTGMTEVQVGQAEPHASRMLCMWRQSSRFPVS